MRCGDAPPSIRSGGALAGEKIETLILTDSGASPVNFETPAHLRTIAPARRRSRFTTLNFCPSKLLKTESVMLSAAKHLLFLVENKQKQILRCAQNDMDQWFFSSLQVEMTPELRARLHHRAGIAEKQARESLRPLDDISML